MFGGVIGGWGKDLVGDRGGIEGFGIFRGEGERGCVDFRVLIKVWVIFTLGIGFRVEEVYL